MFINIIHIGVHHTISYPLKDSEKNQLEPLWQDIAFKCLWGGAIRVYLDRCVYIYIYIHHKGPAKSHTATPGLVALRHAGVLATATWLP